MNYEDTYDSSGTDDDLPPSHTQNRIQRGGRVASGNGRSGFAGSVPYPRLYGETDMESQIHQLEQEAYSSVLRAFKAQADAITWEKESLITELRKELRLSNEEHRELLGKVNSDEGIRRIREWRQSGGMPHGMLNTGQAVHDPVPSPTVSASRKKQKISQSLQSQSFGGPTPNYHTQTATLSNQPSSSAGRRGPLMGSIGKKHKPGQILPGASSLKMQQYPSSGPAGRGQVANRVSSVGLAGQPAEPIAFSPLLGKKVRTRWPDDNSFYEAVITNYNPEDDRHALVYDMGTVNETWEWVNLSEISREDIQWEGEEPAVTAAGRGRGGISRTSAGRGRGGGGGIHSKNGGALPRKDFPTLQQNGLAKKASGEIHLLHTESLIKEVEKVFGANHPDPAEVEKAKKVLKEHEQALADALTKLADISDGESDGGRRFGHPQAMERE
jgi:hypothetical protein